MDEVKGAYIDTNVEQCAPQMYNYFASLLAMDAEQAKATISTHTENARERRIAWAASQAEPVAMPATFMVDDNSMDVNGGKALKRVIAKKGNCSFSSGTSSPAELNHLAWLLVNGYTLSR